MPNAGRTGDGGSPRRQQRHATARSGAVTIGDVARRAGVSVATVSRALRALPNVSSETRRRVQEAAHDLDYHIDRTASRLATGRTETVGVVVPALDAWYFSRVLAGVEATLGEAGYDLLVTSVSDVASRHRLASGNAPLRKRVDGLIFVDELLTDDEIEALRQTGMRVVTVGQRTGCFPAVTVDHREAARAATEHLVELGHRRIACVSGFLESDLTFSVPGQRQAGHHDALRRVGVEAPAELVVRTGPGLEHGAEVAHRLMAIDEPPTAFLASSDELAGGVLLALRSLGLAVPRQVSVVGFDDREVSAAIGLTTVWQDPCAQGRAAAELLVESATMAGPEGDPREVVAGTRLVVRHTTGPATGSA
jgi:LacI family transcriptional regulator, repressor for deo operon, udp, cdd, tsx, nupC, and nupG